jgi:pyruvoyl-dependent arginine decarboxylase (PvlArgDC)
MVLTVRGVSTPSDVTAAFDAALADPSIDAPNGVLLDSHQASIEGLTDGAIREVASHFARQSSRVGMRRALVVSTALDEEHGRIAAIYEDVWHGVELRVFPEKADAEAWLSSPEEGQ